MSSSEILATKLLAWYDDNGRRLPWRTSPSNPYFVFISEVMLQQTTVSTVIPYFQRWIQKWPTLKALSCANLDDILHVWQGLGYYNRARNLYLCAQKLIDYQYQFPQKESELLALPGIGPYTARAIMAIAFHQKVVTIDGNIARVFSRILEKPGHKDSLLTSLKEDIAPFLPLLRVGDYTQALMDLGATICRPQQPMCFLCPLQRECQSYQNQTTHLFPQKKEKVLKPVRWGHFFFAMQSHFSGQHILLEKENRSLLRGLWRPLTSEWTPDQREPIFPYPTSWQCWGEIKHIFTHFELHLKLWYGCVNTSPSPNHHWVSLSHINDYPISSLAKKALQAFKKSANYKPEKKKLA